MSSRLRLGSGRQRSKTLKTSNDLAPALSDPSSDFWGRSSTRELHSSTALTYFPSAMFATVLEDTIIKTQVLIDSNIESAMSRILADIDLHTRNKYGVVESLDNNQLEDFIDKRRLESDEFKLRKMNKDRIFFTEVIFATYLDLALCLNYQSLTAKNKEILHRKKDYFRIKEEVIKNRIHSKEMHKQLRLLNMKNKTMLYDANALLDKLQKDIGDSELTRENQVRYVEKWERARSEQHIEVLGMNEKKTNSSIRYYRKKMEHEQDAHSEIDELVNLAIHDIMTQVETWMTKYDDDIEAMDLKIQLKKNEYEQELEKRMNIEETIKQKEKQMSDWKDFKRKREIAQKYESDMHRCAIIIQSWWRGLLVRKQLGPYKPRKTKKGKKKA